MKLAPDWNRTAADYARHRAGFPDWFYDRMAERGLFQPGTQILDIGTGSGCIAISLKKHRPEWSVFAIDVSENALEVAKINALKNHTLIEFFNHDILPNTDFFVDVNLYMETNDAGPLKLDIIVSNPPYVAVSEKSTMEENVLNYEPHLALFVPDNDPLVFYKVIAAKAVVALKPGGRLMVEINERFGNEVREVFTNAGFTNAKIIKDLQGKDRIVSARK